MINYLKKIYQDYILDKSIIKPWLNDEFLYELKKINSRIDPKRNFILKQFLLKSLMANGNVAEFGVYKGASALFIAEIIKNENRKLFLFDTFCGSPKSSKFDLRKEKDYYDDVLFGDVKNKFSIYNNVHFFKGLLPDTIPDDLGELCFAHIHLNLYNSTLKTLESIYEKIALNGIILIEDYGLKQCKGVKKAVDQFLKSKSQNRNLVYLPTCQAVYFKE